MHPLAPILCATLPAAACAVAHYVPWRHWFKRGRAPRPLAYAIGMLAILLPATLAAWLAAATVAEALGLFWLAAGSAAAGTLTPWTLDDAKRKEQERQDEADRLTLYGE